MLFCDVGCFWVIWKFFCPQKYSVIQSINMVFQREKGRFCVELTKATLHSKNKNCAWHTDCSRYESVLVPKREPLRPIVAAAAVLCDLFEAKLFTDACVKCEPVAQWLSMMRFSNCFCLRMVYCNKFAEYIKFCLGYWCFEIYALFWLQLNFCIQQVKYCTLQVIQRTHRFARMVHSYHRQNVSLNHATLSSNKQAGITPVLENTK